MRALDDECLTKEAVAVLLHMKGKCPATSSAHLDSPTSIIEKVGGAACHMEGCPAVGFQGLSDCWSIGNGATRI